MLLNAGAQHRDQDGLGVGAGRRAAAAPDLAVDHGRPGGLLGPVVGGVQAGMVKEGEQLVL